MNKLKMQTPNLTDKNIEHIAKLFPNVITEIEDEATKDTKGHEKKRYKKAIDFDLLKQSLSDVLIDDENERYRLDWPGKKASLLKANTPISKTLRPCREESVNFDTTENLYIEGDNFEVLKILQESYLGKIKMIYIDPPYNTGSDFIYKDNFKASKDDYEEEIGAVSDDGDKLFKNTDSNGRFHSDWLSMMYERLIVARDVLKDDGVIFISIDDNESSNLQKISSEVFGESNFLGILSWIKRTKPINSGDAKYQIQQKIEYVIVYCKNKNRPNTYAFQLPIAETRNYDHNGKHGKCRLKSIEDSDIGGKKRDTMKFEILGVRPDEGKRWKIGKDEVERLIKLDRVRIINNKIKIEIYPDDEDGFKYKPFWSSFNSDTVSTAESGKAAFNELMREKLGFDTIKPVDLLTTLMIYLPCNDDIILDFFSGSATTAHAVMQLNAEDNGNRKFIMVQLPEKTDEKSEAYKAGYKTIAEIGKERIRRAGKKILEESATKNTKKHEKNGELFSESENLSCDSVSFVAKKDLDIGFRVYKTDTTNMKDVYYHPEKLGQKELFDYISNIKENRTPDDLLTQVILDLGLELNLPIEKKEILGNTVFIVQTNALVACFDDNINFKIVDEIADLKPFKVVFKDAGFSDDKDRINVEERFKRLSPETKVTVI